MERERPGSASGHLARIDCGRPSISPMMDIMSTHDPSTNRPPSDHAAGPHPARLHPDALAAECGFRTTRRSGPGGQNRNKVETAVILTHRPTGISAEASEWRTQGENRRKALVRL